ncbi:HIRAN domain-containing protein [Microbacterium paludicola]|uniref:HIRAN domain-containing protein n=1 Tax=Microbacterium paludicola TaxID=300019 RepID=UPI0031D436A5
MATQALDRDQLDLTASRKTLILIWQNPASRLFVKVGQLDALPGGRFAFQYLSGAWSDSEFVPLLEYPDRDTAYLSDEVPAFFANRVLSVDRPNYDRYLSWLGIEGLNPEDVPFEVLARTGGGRATDTFHVVELPVTHSNRLVSRFFVSGIRYFAGADQAVATLRNGASLRLELEEDNEVNPKAVLVSTVDGLRFGYVPDWLCADVHTRIKDGWSIIAVAERVNHDAPAHVRILCRLEASRR